jgi:hypothetical protein
VRQHTTFVLAADIGQANDFTALSILQSYGTRERGASDFDPVKKDRRHDLIHLERFREIPYPEQIRRIAERYRELEQHARELNGTTMVRLVVDATGVGKPILDAFREGGLRPRGVIITGGETATRGDSIDRVPKRELVTTLQVALQSRRLRIADELPLAETLLRELRGFRVKISLSGHASFGNDVGTWREADHDDLVLSVALAVWLVEARKMPSRAALREASGLAA